MKKNSIVSKLIEEVSSLGITLPVMIGRSKKSTKNCSPSIFTRKSSADVNAVTCLTNSRTSCKCGLYTSDRGDGRLRSIDSNCSRNSKNDEQYILALIFFAIQYKNHELLQSILDRSLADVNKLNEDGISALHFAAIVGTSNCMKVLQENGGCVNTLDIRGQTPIYYARMMDNDEAVKYLKACGSKD